MSGVSKMRIYASLYFHSMFFNMTYEIIFAINMEKTIISIKISKNRKFKMKIDLLFFTIQI